MKPTNGKYDEHVILIDNSCNGNIFFIAINIQYKLEHTVGEQHYINSRVEYSCLYLQNEKQLSIVYVPCSVTVVITTLLITTQAPGSGHSPWTKITQ